VTIETEGDQIMLTILAGVAAKLLMVNFEVRPGATRLTTSAVSLQHSRPKVSILQLAKPSRHLFW